MSKEFKQFYELWTVVDSWKKNHHSWLHDPFEEINAAEVEDIVDGASKTMA